MMHLRLIGVACLLSLYFALAPAAHANEPIDSQCGWGPVGDVEAVRKLLGEWAASADLPGFDPSKWNAAIDHSNVWVRLGLEGGELKVGWTIGDDCEITAITIEPSAAYTGRRPDEASVKQLAETFRALAVEKRLQLYTAKATRPVTRVVPPVAIVLLVAAMLAAVLLPSARRWRATGHPTHPDVVRLLGIAAIIVLLPYEPRLAEETVGDWLQINTIVLLGVLPLVLFLWLALCGAFGYGSARRADWPALLVFLLALAIREGYARHAIQEIEIYFYYGAFASRHSVVHPLFEMFVQSHARDPYWFMMHVNGVLGALATLPLFLFVRQRTDSRMTAAMVALFYAVHPLIVQMTPTDGPYALVLSTWFAGLVLLTASEIGPRQLFGGAVLLGIAATSRAEGSLYLLASLLLIDVRALLRAARRHAGVAALSACSVLALGALQAYLCFGIHITPGQSLPNIGTFTFADVLRAGLFSEDFNDPVFVRLVGLGALAGLVNRRMRLGLGATLAAIVVVWPLSMTTTGGFTVLHRYVPVCALQVIAVGVGVGWLTTWLPAKLRHHWAAAIPGVVLALFLFAKHHHEVRNPNAVTDEFWMLRNHLAPGGVVNSKCTLMSVGRAMDTDIHDFQQVLPGMQVMRCELEDCVKAVSRGGCFFYLRSLNCYFAEVQTPPECVERGRTPGGDLFACMDPRCVEIEKALELSPVEERTVDLFAVFHGLPERPQWARNPDIGLYKVVGVRRTAR